MITTNYTFKPETGEEWCAHTTNERPGKQGTISSLSDAIRAANSSRVVSFSYNPETNTSTYRLLIRGAEVTVVEKDGIGTTTLTAPNEKALSNLAAAILDMVIKSKGHAPPVTKS